MGLDEDEGDIEASHGGAAGGRRGPFVLAESVGVVSAKDEALQHHPHGEGGVGGGHGSIGFVEMAATGGLGTTRSIQ